MGDGLGRGVSGGWGVEEVVAQGFADAYGAVEVGEPEKDDGQAYERSIEDGGLNMAGLDERHEGVEGGEDQVESDGVEGPAGSDDNADGGDDAGKHDEDGGDGDDQQCQVNGGRDRDGMYHRRRGGYGRSMRAGDAGHVVKHAVHIKEREKKEDWGEELEDDEK